MSLVEYFRPSSIEEAIDLLAGYGESAIPVAGGLVVSRRAMNVSHQVEALVDLNRIPGLRQITVREGNVNIGALASYREITQHNAVRMLVPLLATSLASVPSIRIQEQATIGGGIASLNWSPDIPSPLIALDAVLQVQGTHGTREVSAVALLSHNRSERLEASDLIKSVRLPIPVHDHKASYVRFTAHSVIRQPRLTVGVRLGYESERLRDIRIAVNLPHAFPVRCIDAEQHIEGNRYSSSLLREAATIAKLETVSANAMSHLTTYDGELTEVVVRRTLAAAIMQLAGRGIPGSADLDRSLGDE